MTRTVPLYSYSLCTDWPSIHHLGPWCQFPQGSWEDSRWVHQTWVRLLPTLRGEPLAKENELVVYRESKQRSGCLSGWEGAGDSILCHDAELDCLWEQTHAIICPWIPAFANLFFKTMYPEGSALPFWIATVVQIKLSLHSPVLFPLSQNVVR